MSAYRVLSLLLEYPDGEPAHERPDLREAVGHLPRGAARDGLEAFLASAAGLSPGELRAEYVRTFDFDRRSSLYLTFHTHGDRRQRGLELVRLKRRFAAAGFVLGDGELPDYLPALLEFAALAPDEGEAMLAEQRAPLELVRARLHETGSRYRHLLDALVAGLPPLTRRQAQRARDLAEQGPPAELVGLEPFASAYEGAT